MRKSAGFLVALLVLGGCGIPDIPDDLRTDRVGIAAPKRPGGLERGPMDPVELSAQSTRQLTADAAKLRPALLKLRAAKDFRPESAVAVLTAAGYRESSIFVQPDTMTEGVVFGVPDGAGCLVGGVWDWGVSVEPRGTIVDWGCAPMS